MSQSRGHRRSTFVTKVTRPDEAILRCIIVLRCEMRRPLVLYASYFLALLKEAITGLALDWPCAEAPQYANGTGIILTPGIVARKEQ